MNEMKWSFLFIAVLTSLFLGHCAHGQNVNIEYIKTVEYKKIRLDLDSCRGDYIYYSCSIKEFYDKYCIVLKFCETEREKYLDSIDVDKFGFCINGSDYCNCTVPVIGQSVNDVYDYNKNNPVIYRFDLKNNTICAYFRITSILVFNKNSTRIEFEKHCFLKLTMPL